MMDTNLDLKDQILLTKLKGKGIAKLNISFSGSGDSGDVDDVGYETNDGINSWQLDLNSRLIESEEETAVKDMIYTWLSNNLRYDWVNNEGGSGTLNINLSDFSWDLDYYERTIQEHNFDGQNIFRNESCG